MPTTTMSEPDFLDFFEAEEFDPWTDAEGVPLLEIDLQDLAGDGPASATEIEDHYLLGGTLLLWIPDHPRRALSVWTLD